MRSLHFRNFVAPRFYIYDNDRVVTAFDCPVVRRESVADQRRAVIFSVSGAPQHIVCYPEQITAVGDITKQAVVPAVKIADIQLRATRVEQLLQFAAFLVKDEYY